MEERERPCVLLLLPCYFPVQNVNLIGSLPRTRSRFRSRDIETQGEAAVLRPSALFARISYLHSRAKQWWAVCWLRNAALAFMAHKRFNV